MNTQTKINQRYELLSELKDQRNARSYDHMPTMLYANVKIHHTPYDQKTIDELLAKSTMTQDDINSMMWEPYGLIQTECQFLCDWWNGYEYNDDEPEAKRLELLREHNTKDRAGYFNGRSGGWYGILELGALESLLEEAQDLLDEDYKEDAEDSINTFDTLLEAAEWAIGEAERRADNLDLTEPIAEYIEANISREQAEQSATVALYDAIRTSTLFDSTTSPHQLDNDNALQIEHDGNTFEVIVNLHQ